MATSDLSTHAEFGTLNAQAIVAQQAKLRMLIEEAEQSEMAEWQNIAQEIEQIFNE